MEKPEPSETAALEERVAELESENKELEYENESLWREVAALQGDVRANGSTLDRISGQISSIFGFSPKSPDEACRLMGRAFALAMDDAGFRAERETMLLAYRDRMRTAMRRSREYAETEEEVERIRREMNAIEAMKHSGLYDRLDEVKARLEAAGARLLRMQEEFK